VTLDCHTCHLDDMYPWQAHAQNQLPVDVQSADLWEQLAVRSTRFSDNI
jgi:hypothetical protein